MPPPRNYVGQQNASKTLTAVRYIPGQRRRLTGRIAPKIECVCECGKTTVIPAHCFTRDAIKSCGCRKRHGYTVDESRFAAMDTPDEAYWLGMLFTDGCVSSGKPNIHLGLQPSDGDHVRLFAKFLGCSRPVPNGNKITQFTVGSRLITNSLARLGMTPRKTWTITPWKGPDHLMPHFWRGCMDGDGGIANYHPKRKAMFVHFCGNVAMVNGFATFVENRLDITGDYHTRLTPTQAKLQNGHRFASVRYHRFADCQAIIKLLGYDQNVVALERKRIVAQSILDFKTETPWAKITRNELLTMFKAHGKWSLVAKATGMSAGNLSHHVKRHGITRADIAYMRR